MLNVFNYYLTEQNTEYLHQEFNFEAFSIIIFKFLQVNFVFLIRI